MHWVPQSWSHWHILVSVFPSVGLLFLLGFYVGAITTDNEVMKRTCLVLFVVLTLLAIPTYISGDHSMALLSQNPKISKDLMGSHFGWGVLALAFLALTGVAALIALWRSWSGRLTDNMLHLILGLAIVTLALMVVAGEGGWEISHHELRLDPKTQKTSQAWSHAHIIFNHFPTVGFVFALAFYVIALLKNNDGMKRGSLVLIRHLRHLGHPGLRHRRRFDVGTDRSRDPRNFQGRDQCASRLGAVDALWPRVHRRRRLDRIMEVSAPRSVFQPLALPGPGFRDHYLGRHGRNRPPRRADQSSRDPFCRRTSCRPMPEPAGPLPLR